MQKSTAMPCFFCAKYKIVASILHFLTFTSSWFWYIIKTQYRKEDYYEIQKKFDSIPCMSYDRICIMPYPNVFDFGIFKRYRQFCTVLLEYVFYILYWFDLAECVFYFVKSYPFNFSEKDLYSQ